jgi:uncharacterized protein (TIGR00730 family)
MRSVCVYCGSNAGNKPVYAERAIALGNRLAKERLALVYGGGNVGLMGIVADAVLEAGGEVIGVIPEQLVEWEVAHKGLTRLEVVANMHERKARMFDLSDGFVALPGGFGTLDEMFEMLTWRQLGIGDKPCAFPRRGRLLRTVARDAGSHGRGTLPPRGPAPRSVAWRRHRGDARLDARLPSGGCDQVDGREAAQGPALRLPLVIPANAGIQPLFFRIVGGAGCAKSNPAFTSWPAAGTARYMSA